MFLIFFLKTVEPRNGVFILFKYFLIARLHYHSIIDIAPSKNGNLIFTVDPRCITIISKNSHNRMILLFVMMGNGAEHNLLLIIIRSVAFFVHKLQ